MELVGGAEVQEVRRGSCGLTGRVAGESMVGPTSAAAYSESGVRARTGYLL